MKLDTIVMGISYYRPDGTFYSSTHTTVIARRDLILPSQYFREMKTLPGLQNRTEWDGFIHLEFQGPKIFATEIYHSVTSTEDRITLSREEARTCLASLATVLRELMPSQETMNPQMKEYYLRMKTTFETLGKKMNR